MLIVVPDLLVVSQGTEGGHVQGVADGGASSSNSASSSEGSAIAIDGCDSDEFRDLLS